MEKETVYENTKTPPKTPESNSGSQGTSHHTADRKLPAAENFESLQQQQQRRRQRQEAYGNKLSEILNLIHKTTPCSTIALDKNERERKERADLDVSGPQYTFDNYDDDTAVAEDFYQGKGEAPDDDKTVSAVGKVHTFQSRPVIAPENASENGENLTSKRKEIINNNVETTNNLSNSQQHDEESDFHDRPGAVAVGLDNYESYRSVAGTTFTRLRSQESSQLDISDLEYSIFPRNSPSEDSSSTAQNEKHLPEAVQPYVVEESDVEIPRGTSNKGNLDSSSPIAETVYTVVMILSIGVVLIAGIVVMIVLVTKKRQDRN